MDREELNAKWLRRSKVCTFIVAILLPFALFASSQIETKTAEVSQWLPDDSPERVQYDLFRQKFGNDLFLVVSWDGCDLDDQRVEQFKTELMRRAAIEHPGLIEGVDDSQAMIDQLMVGSASLSKTAARKRLEGAFIGADGQSLLWIQLANDSKETNENVIALTIDVLTSQVGVPESAIHLAGSAYHATEVDRASSESAKHLILPASGIAIFVAWMFIGRLKLAMIVFGLAAIGQICGMALVVVTGGSLNAVTIVMPTLIFMLTTSAAVHLVNYFFEAKLEGMSNPAVAAVRAGATPCTLASITTVIGLSSLIISKLQPVRDFGVYAGSALLVATAILLTTFMFLVYFFANNTTSSNPGWRQSVREQAKGVGNWFVELILRRSEWVVVLGVFVILVGVLGVNRLRSSVDLKEMFPADAKIVKDFHWIEDEIAPLLSIEAIVGVPTNKVEDVLERLRIVRGIGAAINKTSNVKSVTSAVTFLPPIPKPGSSIRNTTRKSVFRTAVTKEEASLIDNGLLSIADDVEYWRISANVIQIEQDGLPVLTDIEAACQPLMEKLSDRGVTLEFTGLSPVIYEAKNLLFRDLLVSFMLAFALITPVMMWILRSFAGGLLVMIPNVAPVAVVFGAMGWMKIPVDIASILTASVAFGIAVDDTLHFVTWFRKGQQRGMRRAEAVRFAYARCSMAMFQTTLIFCSALSVFLWVEFLPIRTFAILMSAMLGGAVIADLVLLPAILSGRLGQFIKSA